MKLPGLTFVDLPDGSALKAYSPNVLASPIRLTPKPESSQAAVEPPSSTAPVLISHFWLQFPDFVPEPTGAFKHEFWRPSTSQGWTADVKRKREVEALIAEFDFYYGKI